MLTSPGGGGGGGGRSMLTGGGGGEICQNLADVICEAPLEYRRATHGVAVLNWRPLISYHQVLEK